MNITIASKISLQGKKNCAYFILRFKALPYGTFWYHSHLGAQRSDGIAGALIILKRPQLPVSYNLIKYHTCMFSYTELSARY